MNSINNRFSVLIPDGESPFALAVTRCLGQFKGIRVDICSSDFRTPNRFSKHVNDFFCRDSQDNDENRLEKLRHQLKMVKPDLVLPVSESAIRFLSMSGHHLKDVSRITCQPDIEYFDIANDKWRLSEFLKARGMPRPDTFLYNWDSETVRMVSDLEYPVLAKPTQGGYGQGIERIDNQRELQNYAERHRSSGPFIVQSYIEGYDIDCSVLCRQGKILAYTIQKGIIPGYHRFGSASGVEFVHCDEVYGIVKDLMASLHWSGVAHIDLRYDQKNNRFNIIEVNPRYWGSLLGSLIAGVNFPHLACISEMGIDFPMPAYKEVRFLAGKAAMKSLWSCDGLGFNINDTTIQYIMKDPLPDIYQAVSGEYNGMMNRVLNLFI